MAEQKKAPKHVADENVDVMELEPVKQIEIETKNLVASSRVFIYTIIGLLAYMIFMVIPSIEEKVHGWKKILLLFWFNQRDLKSQREYLQEIINVHLVI